MRLLGGHPPEICDVAKELGMSRRTLQRRITEERTTFRQLIGDARRELARHYVLQPALELAEVACLLGYEDPNSFFRAFREWEGTTPSEWRRGGSGK
jgi:AraC-like DNA-binding protein